MENKLFNCSIIQKSSELWLVSYGSEKPTKDRYKSFDQNEIIYVLESEINKWKQTKQETLIHPSQVEAFDKLARKVCFEKYKTWTGYKNYLEQGIDIPSDNIYIDWSTDPNKIEPLKLYAFLRVKEDSNIDPEFEFMALNPHCKQTESCSNSLSKKCICPKEDSKQEETQEQKEIEIINKFLKAMQFQDYKKWNSFELTTEQLYRLYNPLPFPSIKDAIKTMEEKLESAMPEVHRQVKVYEDNEKAGILKPLPIKDKE